MFKSNLQLIDRRRCDARRQIDVSRTTRRAGNVCSSVATGSTQLGFDVDLRAPGIGDQHAELSRLEYHLERLCVCLEADSSWFRESPNCAAASLKTGSPYLIRDDLEITARCSLKRKYATRLGTFVHADERRLYIRLPRTCLHLSRTLKVQVRARRRSPSILRVLQLRLSARSLNRFNDIVTFLCPFLPRIIYLER